MSFPSINLTGQIILSQINIMAQVIQINRTSMLIHLKSHHAISKHYQYVNITQLKLDQVKLTFFAILL